ncbi:cysteine synthase family protein [Aliikangiella marina]|uniref:Cysteine synthase B n=1 Tax=Aliikangiella marina TaxID=1712262 RepID=A0A545T2H9_9GAMM|nr:cysteine synthase family protein [Aliikangiella marina]TQV71420.1 cysteine synthase family protein [Aliikangiella marina]
MSDNKNNAVYTNVLDMIGNTAMVELSNLDTGVCRLLGKLELNNPTGSIKDRIALNMIEKAEATGALKPGQTIVEATAGNTGLGLALVAAQKGYKLVIVLPDKMSVEKEYNLKAMGAEVIRTRSDVEKGHPEYYQDLAETIAKEKDAFFVNQFGNPANVEAHLKTTGPEIWQQTQGEIDAFVCGVGSGGTLSGVGGYLKSKKPSVEIVLADPVGSILAPLHHTGEAPPAGKWLVEGIGEDFVPSICDLALLDHAYSISDKEAMLASRELLLKEGLMAGSSSGVLLQAALNYCRQQTEPKTVVTLICDTGNRYLSKLYNNDWMREKGFID